MKSSPRHRQEGWSLIVLTRIRSSAEIKKVKQWCKDNFVQKVRTIPVEVSTESFPQSFKFCIATEFWIKSEEDAFLFRLKWSDYE